MESKVKVVIGLHSRAAQLNILSVNSGAVRVLVISTTPTLTLAPEPTPGPRYT